MKELLHKSLAAGHAWDAKSPQTSHFLIKHSWQDLSKLCYNKHKRICNFKLLWIEICGMKTRNGWDKKSSTVVLKFQIKERYMIIDSNSGVAQTLMVSKTKWAKGQKSHQSKEKSQEKKGTNYSETKSNPITSNNL